jgi:hypothetical protein
MNKELSFFREVMYFSLTEIWSPEDVGSIFPRNVRDFSSSAHNQTTATYIPSCFQRIIQQQQIFYETLLFS